MTTFSRPAKGFTLVEMMLAVTLLTVVIGAATATLMQVNGASERVRRVGDTQGTARQALDALAADLRMAGAGMSSGLVGVAPAAGGTRRIPVVYSGPDVVVTGPGGQQIATNSIFIISSDAQAGVPASDGNGMFGVVASASTSTPLNVSCVNQQGNAVDCSSAAFGNNALLTPLADGSLPPLIVGDYRNAVYMRPVALSGLAGNIQSLDFSERLAGAFSPDPKAPFGFAPGAALSKARVLHYYLKFNAVTNNYELVRSHPILSGNPLGANCLPTDNPFIDETNDPAGPVGTPIGSGPVESLQIRFITDPAASDDPQQFSIWRGGDPAPTTNHLTLCDTGLAALSPGGVPFLREIRLQIVARAWVSDRMTDPSKVETRYSTPGFEGVAPGNNVNDAFPRRSFTARVVPRNMQGIIRL
jgi:prepilin-type N-terminal cleavage/methylation domain-containing protein